ncbi:hypothetical protein Agub_g1073, partial [Astrephomene gubernaculifera]
MVWLVVAIARLQSFVRFNLNAQVEQPSDVAATSLELLLPLARFLCEQDYATRTRGHFFMSVDLFLFCYLTSILLLRKSGTDPCAITGRHYLSLLKEGGLKGAAGVAQEGEVEVNGSAEVAAGKGLISEIFHRHYP